MSRKQWLLIGVGLLSFMLSGCWERKPSYLYLMLHPEYLQSVYNQCVEEVTDSSLPCQIIMRAQADFTSLVNQREEDAERFGAQILQAQENSVFLKSKFNATWQAYQDLGKTKPTEEQLKNMRIELDKARTNYVTAQDKVKVLLSVVAATSTV